MWWLRLQFGDLKHRDIGAWYSCSYKALIGSARVTSTRCVNCSYRHVVIDVSDRCLDHGAFGLNLGNDTITHLPLIRCYSDFGSLVRNDCPSSLQRHRFGLDCRERRIQFIAFLVSADCGVRL